MLRKSLRRQAGGFLLLFLCLPLALRAQLSKEDHEAAEKMISGTLYLRLQAPQRYGMGMWAPYSVSQLEASPSGASAERKVVEPLKPIPWNGYHLKNEIIYWGYLANTPINHCKLVSEKGILVVWCERVSPNTEVSVDFIDIKSLDDFTKAFNFAFSKVPLQEEHPDWPVSVYKGIASDNLVDGMTMDQVRIVTGVPLSVSTSEDGGVKTETWMLRQDPGRVLGWSKKHGAWMDVATQTGLPVSITFKDGKLLTITETGSGIANAASAEPDAYKTTVVRKVDSAGNAWLDAHKTEAPQIDIGGGWHQHAWGNIELHQGASNGEVDGRAPGYEMVGVVSGKKVYLIFASKGQVEYSAIMSLTTDGRLVGKYYGDIIQDESKGSSIDLVKR